MISLYLNIIMIVVYIIVIIFSREKRKYIDRHNHHGFITKGGNFYIKIGFVFFGLSVLLHVISIILYAFKVNIGVWVVFGFATFLGLLTSLMFIDVYLNFETIDGDYLYVTRFSKTKKFNLYDVKYGVLSGMIIPFYDKDGKYLFMLDGGTSGCYELLEMIEEKQSKTNQHFVICGNSYIPIEGRELLPNADDIFKGIGKEYKETLPKKRKLVSIIMIIIISLSIILGPLFYISSQNPSIITLAILIILVTIIWGTNFITSYKKEKRTTNLNLGKKHYFNNEKVIGCAIVKRNKKKIVSIILPIISFIVSFSFLIGLIFERDVKQEDLIEVNGTVEYIEYHKVDKTYNILIGIEGTSIEYRIGGVSLSGIDKNEMLKEIDKGENIYLSVDKKTKDANGIIDKNKNQWTYVYEISTDDKTYLTFDEYLINERKDDYFGWGIVSLSVTIGLISIIYSLFIKRGIKEKLSKEYISVYY